MQEVINYKTVQDAKSYVSTGGITFPKPSVYVDRFLESVGVNPEDCEFQLKQPITNANEDNTLNVAYSRLMVETKLDFKNAEMGKTLGFVLGLDTQKPILKVYTGARVYACTNLSVFNSDSLFQCDPIQNLDDAYKMVKQYKTEAEEEWRRQLETWKNLQETVYSGSQVNTKMGKMLELVISDGKFKGIGSTAIVQAARNLYDKNSIYRISEDKTTAWNVLNAITQSITDSNDFLGAPTKSYIATKLILNPN